jgi:threonine synthase
VTTRYTGLIQHYCDRLSVADPANGISLGEGRTPLIRTANLPRRLGFAGDIYLKFEGLNPTGSFKDRGMTVAVTKAYEEGSRAVICASTGNTSASAAAYAARAGMKAFVLIPEGKIALGKLSQAMLHGAKVVQIRGNFDKALEIVRQLVDEHPITLVNSLNPTASRARRRPPSRWWRSWASPPITTPCRWATPVTSPPTGWATASTPARGAARGR